MTGNALLEVGASGSTSFVSALRSSNPLRLLAPIHRGPSVWAYTSSLGGGMVAGDETRLELRLAPGSRTYLGTQSSSKIYRNPDRPTCRHLTTAHLEAGSLLVFAPDPVQPFAESRFRQHQRFHLDPSAGLVLVDALSAGRTARGERWDFAAFESRNEVLVDGRLRFLDILALRPEDGPLRDPFRLHDAQALALLVFFGPPAQPAVRFALDSIQALPVNARATSVVAVSPVNPDGAVVRIASREAADTLRLIRHFLAPIVPQLGDDPWARRF